ncbi:MAG TPA: hypothetical protein VM469_13815 [Pseudoxanthomonas sp.]|nr:hypothetical protein [Pseudoxanthomonas sp.]
MTLHEQSCALQATENLVPMCPGTAWATTRILMNIPLKFTEVAQ